MTSEYFCTNSALGANMRAADQFQAGARDQPRQNPAGAGFVERVGSDDDVSQLLGHREFSWAGLLRFVERRAGADGRLAAKDLKHHHAAGRTLAFDGFAPVLHGFFHGLGNFFFCFAFNTISFRHKIVLHHPLQAVVSQS